MNVLTLALSVLKARIYLFKWAIGSALAIFGLLVAAPAWAHHPSGGDTPDHWLPALLSGIGHPVIGLDHLAFVIAAGLLAALVGGGFWVPITFVMASVIGAGIHLMGIDLPFVELTIAASVLLAGLALALKTPPRRELILGFTAIAGLFHGFAYAEAIFGAEAGPLVAYLLGFSLIQLAIAGATYALVNRLKTLSERSLGSSLQPAGLVICGIGLTLVMTQVVDTLLPA
ncbi:MAG: HupE/UreJ family protein [Leptolyngbyaceae cyanobacterium]